MMLRLSTGVVMALAIATTGCSANKDAAPRPKSAGAAAEPPADVVPGSNPVASPPPAAAVGEVDAAPVDAATAVAAPAGQDFIAEARLLYRIAACGDQSPLPAHIDQGVVARHCKDITKRMDAYRKRYVDGARDFFEKLIPKDLPSVVVYPFGGGDLNSALVAFSDATEITTISLELAGDPRRITNLSGKALEDSLAGLRVEIGGLLTVGSNTSKNLAAGQQNDLPGQVSSFLMGLAVNGFEPVSMRYFRIEADGSLHYLSAAEIEALDEESAAKLKHDWESPNFSPAFAHVEIGYRRVGDPQDAPVRIHRHIGWNLGDGHLKQHGELIKHLEAKGIATMLTKGASYLLWRGDFSIIRDYLINHMAWMLSDSTGIPPAYAKKAGLVQETYGKYSGSFLEASESHNADFVELWAKQPYRKTPVRFGYVDSEKRAHLLVTRPSKPRK